MTPTGSPARHGASDATLQALVRAGRIGTVTHVTFIDRQPPAAGTPASAHVPYAQLHDAAGDHVDRLCAILGVAPVSVVARSSRAPWSPYDHGSTTEAIIEMADGVRIQYHGSLTSNRREQTVWIDGASGVLWTNRSRVWWRKRGWPVFVPMLGRNAQTIAAARDDTPWGRRVVDAAMLSDRTGRIIRLDRLDSLAADAGQRSSSSRTREDAR